MGRNTKFGGKCERVENEIMDHQIRTEEDLKRILVYRERFKFIEEEYTDEEVFVFINELRRLAKIYINEYKNLSPKQILSKLKLSYNQAADKSTMNRSKANAN